MKLLVVAADRREFGGFGDAAGPHEVRLVANGAGIRCAAAAAEQAIQSFRPDALVSTGFCGALAADLEVADIVVADEVVCGERRFPVKRVESVRAHRRGIILTHPRVVQTVAERRTLAATGAVAVEMEAAAVAECACAYSLPFYCVKTVTDLAGETLANDYNRALREDGHFDTIDLLTGTLRDPLARIPELLRLQKRCARAAKALGAFFADCRF